MVYFPQNMSAESIGDREVEFDFGVPFACRAAEGACMDIYLFKLDEMTLALQFEFDRATIDIIKTLPGRR